MTARFLRVLHSFEIGDNGHFSILNREGPGCREGGMMRTYIALVLLVLSGCQNTRGPLAPRPPRPDDPSLSIQEQQVLGRDRIGLPDNSWVLPQEAGARPGR